MRAGPSPLTTVPRPREDGEQEVMAPVQWRDATVGGQDTTGLSLVLPCTEDPELFFAESPQDVELAKAMCRGCRARLACLAGALERREPWGVWGDELLMSGAIVPRKRPRGRPRKERRHDRGQRLGRWDVGPFLGQLPLFMAESPLAPSACGLPWPNGVISSAPPAGPVR